MSVTPSAAIHLFNSNKTSNRLASTSSIFTATPVSPPHLLLFTPLSLLIHSVLF
ncbi:hypothetical protein MA16_Dca020952 [Dendrobium catenatum]|uniref:Uncharacterized protein n=1 Tax=Dendrobium catenatum TaxID=906689 RepID=A0A2I0XFX3_9ASPA|nr:hypothetical protein MA16_Dca020952 [Dendrobium catenatum]